MRVCTLLRARLEAAEAELAAEGGARTKAAEASAEHVAQELSARQRALDAQRAEVPERGLRTARNSFRERARIVYYIRVSETLYNV